MYNPTTVLHKILEIVPRYEFEKIVKSFDADRYTKHFNTWNQFLTILIAQAKSWDSLREIETGFKTHIPKLYHLGLSKQPTRSTISRVNTDRNPEIYEKFFYKLKGTLQPKLIKKKFDFELNKVLKIIDSTTVELSINIFNWAKFRYNKGALKIHTSFNLTDQIPEFVNITDGKVADIRGINFNSYHDCILTFDRIYIDFSWLNIMDQNNVIYVCRAKTNFSFNYLGQHQKPTGEGILKDEIVEFKSQKSKETYQNKLRLVTYADKDTGEVYRYMTNDFEYPAEVIAYIYKKRWEIELFFKWIKQNLKIKTFFGVSENAVKTQIWIAMIYYLLLRYIQAQTSVKSLLELTRVLREIILDNRSIFDIYSPQFRSQTKIIDVDVGQFNLFKT